jgi:hypothetical protein
MELRLSTRWKQDFLAGISPDVFPSKLGYDLWFAGMALRVYKTERLIRYRNARPLELGFRRCILRERPTGPRLIG